MKSGLLICLAAWCAVAFAGCATSQFSRGDSIVLDEVVPNPAKLRIGDVVLLRGHYTLASQSKATLMVSLTTQANGGRSRISPRSRTAVEAGSGTFELEYEIRAAGTLHVSYYPASGGNSFGRLDIAEVGL